MNLPFIDLKKPLLSVFFQHYINSSNMVRIRQAFGQFKRLSNVFYIVNFNCHSQIHTISLFNLSAINLFAMELMFDFGIVHFDLNKVIVYPGLLFFITFMTVNRFLVISTPRDCFVYSNKWVETISLDPQKHHRPLQCIIVLLMWAILIIVLIAFITGNCLRYGYFEVLPWFIN